MYSAFENSLLLHMLKRETMLDCAAQLFEPQISRQLQRSCQTIWCLIQELHALKENIKQTITASLIYFCLQKSPAKRGFFIS
jgi:hypothetical protein